MSSKELPPNSICPSIRVDVAILEDHRFHVLVDLSHDSILGFVDLVQAQVLRQVDDLGTFQAERQVQVGVHHVPSHGHEQVLVLDVP